jgi:hypothetical protein
MIDSTGCRIRHSSGSIHRSAHTPVAKNVAPHPVVMINYRACAAHHLNYSVGAVGGAPDDRADLMYEWADVASE